MKSGKTDGCEKSCFCCLPGRWIRISVTAVNRGNALSLALAAIPHKNNSGGGFALPINALSLLRRC